MTSPNRPDTLASELADLRKRIEKLERSSRLGNSSFKDGTIRIYDEDDLLRVEIGQVAPGYGIKVYNAAGDEAGELLG